MCLSLLLVSLTSLRYHPPGGINPLGLSFLANVPVESLVIFRAFISQAKGKVWQTVLFLPFLNVAASACFQCHAANIYAAEI